MQQLGYGLIGMGERVAAFGGTLRSGPDAAGGWQVARATLPARSRPTPGSGRVASVAPPRDPASLPGRRPGDDPPGPADDPRRRTGLTIVGEAADGAEAVALVPAAKPDVVLMDVRMPKLDGIAACARICAAPIRRGC